MAEKQHFCYCFVKNMTTLHIKPAASCHQADVFSSALLERIKLLELIGPTSFHCSHHLLLPETLNAVKTTTFYSVKTQKSK